MNRRIIQLTLVLSLPLFLGAACSFPGLSGPTGGPAGVWWSEDTGATFEQRSFVRYEKKKSITIGGLSVTQLVMYPLNSQVLYASTQGGIYYSANSGQYWENIFDGGVASDISMEYDREGVVYLAVGNQLLMTPDNGALWTTLYVDSRPGVLVTQVAVDPFNGQRIYIGTSVGDFIMSEDGGQSWQTIYEFNTSIKEILIDPRNGSEIFVASPDSGMWVSYDRAQSWNEITDIYTEFPGSKQYVSLLYDESRPGALLYTSAYGLLWTYDHGRTWTPLELITPPNSIAIKAVALNPLNPNMIYYATDTVMYRTVDGGVNWIAQKLQTPPASALIVDFYDPTRVFMGTRIVKKKKGGLFNPSF